MMKNTLEFSQPTDGGIILPKKRLLRPVTFIGLPGCGKNTQGQILQERLDIPHVDFGESRRKVMAGCHDVQEAIDMSRMSHKKRYKFDIGFRREYVHMILEWNGANGIKDNIALDGAIRDPVGYDSINNIFGDPFFVFFMISRMTSHKRTEMRNERITDRKGGARHGRIMAFNQRTLPILRDMNQQGRVIHINAELSIEKIHQRLLDRLSHEGILEGHTPVSSRPRKKIKKKTVIQQGATIEEVHFLKNLFFAGKRLLLERINSFKKHNDPPSTDKRVSG